MRTQHTDQTTPAVATPGVSPAGLLAALESRLDVPPSRLARHSAELHALRAELDRTRAERDRLREQQRQLAELLESANPEKIVHDLRGVLNELQLLRTLMQVQSEQRTT